MFVVVSLLFHSYIFFAPGALGEGNIRNTNNMTSISSNEGRKAIFVCDITGDPKPTYVWLKNNIVLDSKNNDRISIHTTNYGGELSIKRLKKSDAGFYTCVGRNEFGDRNTTATLTVGPPKKKLDRPKKKGNRRKHKKNREGITRPPEIIHLDRDPPSDGYCEPYRGETCSEYLGDKMIFVGSESTQSQIESKLMEINSRSMPFLNELGETCKSYLKRVLCLTRYTTCSSNSQPRLLCKSECEWVKRQFCSREYDQYSHQLPSCEGLPDNRLCVKLPTSNYNYEPSCYKDNGSTYKGFVSRTISGKVCKKWTGKSYKDYAGHNYCRNPNGQYDAPWCYREASPGGITVEKCDIKRCSDSGEERKSFNTLMVILVPSIAVIFFLTFGLVCICWCRKRRFNSWNGMPPKAVEIHQHALDRCSNLPNIPHFPLNSIIFLHELGEGAFGKVYKGELSYTGQTVAIKTLKQYDGPNNGLISEFEREARLLGDLKHPHVVSLIGVSVRQQPWCMLFEYMTQGDLHELLVLHSGNGNLSTEPLSNRDLTTVAIQIASGMNYLSNKRFVHRDLAARNVLLTEGLNVKISDFGLARNIYSCDYYRVQNSSMLPIRWMAPESIMYGKFTTFSDIWSFGVLLWEMWHGGIQPYAGCSNAEVMEMIQHRHNLLLSSEIPGDIRRLMKECWNESPTRRPNFGNLLIELTKFSDHLIELSHSSNQGSNHSSTGTTQLSSSIGANSYGRFKPSSPPASVKSHNSSSIIKHSMYDSRSQFSAPIAHV